MKLTTPVDLDPDPRTLEIELEARLAEVDLGLEKPATVFTYNGTVPGPLLRARRGDKLVVHFKNNLPQATTIHWHGVRVPAEMDGTTETQGAVAPGGTFEYTFTLPDAGLFWYHPHHRSTEQVAGGLYGAILVDDDAAPPVDFGPEVVLVLSDMHIRPDGTLSPYNPAEVLTPVFGRLGTVLLVNGRVNPTLLARSGQRQRWRIVNAAPSRYFRIGLTGHEMVRIGGDGGLRESPLRAADFVMAPSERADILVIPQGSVPSRVSVDRLPFDRGYHQDTQPPEPLFQVQIVEEPGADAPHAPAEVPVALRTIAPVNTAAATEHSIVMVEGQDDNGNFVFLLNGQPFAGGHDVALSARVGDVNLWTLDNQTGSDHPMHLHGFFFQVIDPNTGAPAVPREWKDTVNVPRQSKLQFVVQYDDRPGMWMYHCHILDHADLGLMGMLHLRR